MKKQRIDSNNYKIISLPTPSFVSFNTNNGISNNIPPQQYQQQQPPPIATIDNSLIENWICVSCNLKNDNIQKSCIHCSQIRLYKESHTIKRTTTTNLLLN